MERFIFNVEHWRRFYRANISRTLVELAAIFPWSDEVLNGPCPFNKNKRVKETHLAFFGMPTLIKKRLTVMALQRLHPPSDQPRFYFSHNPEYAQWPYANETTCEARWHLVLKNIVPGSTQTTARHQEALLPFEYEIPTTIEEVTKDILCFKLTRARPNPRLWARCREKRSDDHLACAGHFNRNGLGISYWCGAAINGVGLGASRKLESRLS